MVKNQTEVLADFTAQDITTEVLEIRLDGLHHVSVHIETGDLVGSVVIEGRRPGGGAGGTASPWEIIETYSVDGTAPTWKTVEIAGGWDFRLRCSAYTSGSARGWLVA